jgi:hypothetical protein
MWCWRRTEKIGWTDLERNKVLLRDKEQRNIVHTVKRRTVNWIVHILHRNCHLRRLKHVIDGKVEGRLEVTGRRERRRKPLLYHLNENKDHKNWKWKHQMALCGEPLLEEFMDLS